MSDYTQKTLNDMPYWERLHNTPGDDSPIVITMHYMTGTATAMKDLFDGVDFPLREIALQGTHPSGFPEEGGFSWFEKERNFYDVLSEAEQEPLIRKETDKIAEFIKALSENSSGKIAIVGMSQGGDLTLHLACYHPELMSLACPIAGRLSADMRPESLSVRALPEILMLYGVEDEIVSVESGREARDWLKVQNYSVTFKEYEGVGHNISSGMIEDIRKAIATL